MATVLHQTAPESQTKSFVQRWFFTGMALAMLAIVVAAFVPSIAHPAGRRAAFAARGGARDRVFCVVADFYGPERAGCYPACGVA